MKLYKLYETVLNESQAEACIAQFGMQLFSPEFGGSEPNTGVETDAIELIDKFSDGKKVNPEFINIAKRLKTCVSSYPEILYPEEMVYKAVKTTVEGLLKSYGNIKIPLRNGQSFRMKYDAKSPIQSWGDDENDVKDDFTTSGNKLTDLLDKFDRAKNEGMLDNFMKFMQNDGLEIKVPIIIYYRTTPNDFIFKGKYFNYLSNNEENEVLRVDDRPIEVNTKIHPPQLSSRLFDLLETLDTWDLDLDY